MTKQFLVTVQTPGDVPADRLETIRAEIEQHAGACVEFYGRQRPLKVQCCEAQPGREYLLTEPWRTAPVEGGA